MSWVYYLLVGLIVFCSNILEAVTGFGATTVALPFVSTLIGIKTGIVVLSMVTWTFGTFIFITNFKKIDWKAYFNIIGFTIIGMPVGMLAFSFLPEKYLKICLGIFVIFAAARGLVITLKKNSQQKKTNKVLLRIIIVIGGIVHGAFASGGPFLVMYASENIKEKSSFRATMCTVWATLNTILLIKYYFTGSIVLSSVLPFYLSAIPFLILGAAIGTYLHKKLSQKTFSIIIYIVLLVAGVTMITTALIG